MEEHPELAAIGMGFTLLRLNMFKDAQLRRSWFVTQITAGLTTQELYFWADARKYGYRCADHYRVKVGHNDVSPDIVW